MLGFLVVLAIVATLQLSIRAIMSMLKLMMNPPMLATAHAVRVSIFVSTFYAIMSSIVSQFEPIMSPVVPVF